MNNLQKGKNNAIAIGHRLNMKARMPTNILKQKQKIMGPDKFKKEVGICIGDVTPLDLGRVLDKYVQEHEAGPKLVKVTGWFTVKISNCQGVANSSIMLALKYAMMPLPVKVYNFQRNGGPGGATGQFLVDNKLLANRMKRLNGKVCVLYSDQIIDIHVESGLPASLTAVELFDPQADLLDAVKATLHARFDRQNQTLYLSRFHAAPQLHPHLCALHALPAMRWLLQLIAREFTQLRVLQLRDNFLCTLRAFSGLSRSNFPALQVLDVGANHLVDPCELEHLKDLNLLTLYIKNNPLAKCQLGMLRNILPQVAIIRNNCNDPNKELDSQQPDELPEHIDFCMRFAKCYYKIFNDVDHRQQLEMFYADGATFLQKMHTINDQTCSSFGLAAVMKAICQLPEIHTDVNEAQVEIQTFNSKLRIFTLSGSCKELREESQTSWNRCKYIRKFVMRSEEASRWIITNETLTLLPPENEGTTLLTVTVNNQSQLNVQLEDLNNNLPKLSIEPETTSPTQLPSFEEIPALVPLSSIETHTNLEQEVDDTLVLSDDEVFLVINEEDLIDSVEL